jgi:hypothetical protein
MSMLLKLPYKILLFFYFLIFLFFYFSIGSINILYAQNIGLGPNDVSLDIYPENPQPHQTVSINIQSFSTNLDEADITWSINGIQKLKGFGKKSLSFTTGKAGEVTNIQIDIMTSIGVPIVKSFSITPNSVDLIAEPETYTPPFFKGKPLFTHQSTVVFVAFPHIVSNGVEIPSEKLIYKWSKDGDVLGSNSGYGKNILTYNAPLISRDFNIDVVVTDPTTNSTAEGSMDMFPQEPIIVFYRKDPLYGVQYNKALVDSYKLAGKEVEITAVPYYFSGSSNTDSQLQYKWSINGNPIEDNGSSPSKVFRLVGDLFGLSDISLSIDHSDRVLQSASENITIDFQKEIKNSVF